MSAGSRPIAGLLVIPSVVLAVALVCVQPVSAAGRAFWKLSSRTAPTALPLAGEPLQGEGDEGIRGEGMVVVSAINLGEANVEAQTEPVTISDQLPAGVEAVKVRAFTGRGVPGAHGDQQELSCETQPARVTCTFSGELPPFVQLELQITVRTTASSPSQPVGRVSVSGGELEETTLQQPVRIGGGSTSFGVEGYELTPEEQNGSTDVQGGSHPFQLTTTFNLNQAYGLNRETGRDAPQAPALDKELQFRLPPGLIGDPAATPQCPDVDFGAQGEEDTNSCPDDTAVGVAEVTFNDPIVYGYQTWAVPVFNLAPAPGEPARFGISVVHVPVILDTSVRTGEDYGVTVTVNDASQAVQILGAQVTLWGTPGDPSHDASRGWNCLADGHWVEAYKAGSRPCDTDEFSNPLAFLTLPTACTNPLTSSVSGQAWSGQTLSAEAGDPIQLEGCNQLSFEPSLALGADQHTASTPTGMTVEVSMPQTSTLSPSGRGEADIRQTTIALPEGVEVNPAAANGLESCSAGEIGFNLATNPGFQEGLDEGAQTENDDFSPGLTEPPCPGPSKLGTVEIQTPLLPEALKGAAYLATQNTNPFNPPLVLYLIATEPTSKVTVKLAGTVSLDPSTGQLTSTFNNTPPLPFEHLALHLFDQHAAQSTPPLCGSYQANAAFTPWSTGIPAAALSGSEGFRITSAANGGSCPTQPLPFTPTLQAGSVNSQAGALTSFQLTLTHQDGQQALQNITVNLPSGIAALLSTVTPCPEPAAAQEWLCGPDSLIGHSTASSGLGSEPLVLDGEVFLTTGYDGAPFGLLVRTLAKAGPFNLGYIDVRERINVNPQTAAVTITTDPGPRGEALPTILKGVPVQLKQVAVTIDRPNFQFNPTNCQPKHIETTLTGAQGTTTTVSSPFQVQGCSALSFKPGVTAGTQGKTSKADGASLNLKFTSRPGEARVAKTILTIPATLPARLTTIQKACIASVFEANPASCPEGSDIGTAIVHTPVLKNPVMGPIYLVSHGNAAWPDAELVLQGEGITVILDGQTAIKKGVTTSSFLSVPDVPFETVQASLPEGPHSALTMNPTLGERTHYNLCAQHLTIPTQLTGQNATLVNDTVKVAVGGCGAVKASKTKRLTRAQKLALALQACRERHEHSRATRAGCERLARLRYVARRPARKRSYTPARTSPR
jgi:hypothetical protein